MACLGSAPTDVSAVTSARSPGQALPTRVLQCCNCFLSTLLRNPITELATEVMVRQRWIWASSVRNDSIFSIWSDCLKLQGSCVSGPLHPTFVSLSSLKGARWRARLLCSKASGIANWGWSTALQVLIAQLTTLEAEAESPAEDMPVHCSHRQSAADAAEDGTSNDAEDEDAEEFAAGQVAPTPGQAARLSWLRLAEVVAGYLGCLPAAMAEGRFDPSRLLRTSIQVPLSHGGVLQHESSMDYSKY